MPMPLEAAVPVSFMAFPSRNSRPCPPTSFHSSEPAVDQALERRHGLLLVGTVGAQPQDAARLRGEPDQSEDALAVHLEVAVTDEDLRLEASRHVHELAAGPHVQSGFVEHHHVRLDHALSDGIRPAGTARRDRAPTGSETGASGAPPACRTGGRRSGWPGTSSTPARRRAPAAPRPA